jgi:hypothetical protein
MTRGLRAMVDEMTREIAVLTSSSEELSREQFRGAG